MILKDRGLPNEKVKNISMSFKKALVTGALFASVAAAGIGLTGCGKNTKEIDPENDQNFNYVVDENTDVVYIKYHKGIGRYKESGLSVAMTIDEKTGEARVMTKADLEKILDYDMGFVEK